MRANRKSLALVLGLLPGLSLCLQGSVLAYVLGAELTPARALADNGGASRERVIAAVEKRFNAKVVRVTDTTVNGRAALELRLLSDQRVFTVVVDAASGQVLSGG